MVALNSSWMDAIVNRFLPWLYLVYALPAVMFLAVAMAPFQVPDEENHALRADQISRGTLISARGGGYVNGALVELKRMTSVLHSPQKQTAEMSRTASALSWSSTIQKAGFYNTAQYGPLLYLPQVVGIWIGKFFEFSVIWTVLLARLINGIASTLLGFAAIRICRRGRALVFTTLLLPMTMSQFASVSQDALIISLSILAGALGSRIIAEQRAASAREFALFAFIVVATTMARPSQIALAALFPAFIDWRDDTWRIKSAIAAFAVAALCWWMAILAGLLPNASADDGSVKDHLVALIVHPLLLPELIFNTVREGTLLPRSLIGQLGWSGALMPNWYYAGAGAIIVLSCLAPGNSHPCRFPAIIGVLTFALMLTGISIALYASWTRLGKMTIDGMQGRYFLPVLPLLGWVAPAYNPAMAKYFSPTWIAVAAFPFVTLAFLPGAIIDQYYGSWSDMIQILKLMYFG